MKKLLKEHSGYILFVCVSQIVISILSTLALVYSDNEIFSNVDLFNDLEMLITTVYSQSWWALILFSLSFATVLTIASIVYKNIQYEFLSIGCIVIMIFPTINVKGNLLDALMNLALFIPIIIIKIIGYRSEAKKIETNNKKKTKKGK